MKSIVMLAAAVLTLTTASAFTQSSDNPTSGTAEKIEGKEVGNKHCPVMTKRDITAKAKSVAYKGHVVKLCCGKCVKEFDKNPEQYLKVAQEDAKK